MTPLPYFLLLFPSYIVWGTSIFGFPEDLFADEIAPYLPTVDLQSLLQTTPSMKSILSHLLAQRHSM